MIHSQMMNAGFKAYLDGKPCEAPTTHKRDRAEWVRGWKAAGAELKSSEKTGAEDENLDSVDDLIIKLQALPGEVRKLPVRLLHWETGEPHLPNPIVDEEMGMVIL